MNFNSIYFYNNWHLGDIHLARGFINFAFNHIPIFKTIPVHFGNRNNNNLLADLNITTNNEEYIKRFDSGFFNNKSTSYFIEDGTLFINTWYAANNYKYINLHGTTFTCLYNVFRDCYLECFNVDLNNYDVAEYFPTIDFSKFYIKDCDEWLEQNTKPKVYISNCLVKSGQANNESWNNVIRVLATRFEHVDFLVTNVIDEKINLPNVHYTEDIINKGSQDLNENAYLSTFCRLIIGKSSGTFSVACLNDNLFRDCDMISFSSFPDCLNNFWIGNIKATCKISNYSREDIGFVIETTSNYIYHI